MTAGSQSNDTWLSPVGSHFRFWLCSESVGAENFEILVEDSDTGSPSSITVSMNYLFAFQFWCCELYMKDWWEGERKHYFVNFCFLAVSESSMGEGLPGGAGSLI